MNGQSYPEVAARALVSVYQQNPAPFYGYLRSGYQQKIFLFHAADDARGWFTALVTAQQPHDYAAVFSAVDLARSTPPPMPGLENFGHTNVLGDPSIGNWLPFLLGLPLGGVGGYFLRKWQEDHPGQREPGIPPHTTAPPSPLAPPSPPSAHPATTSGDYTGGPWLDMAGPQVGGSFLNMEGPAVGGPWRDMIAPPQVGAQYGITDAERKRAWPLERALIQSAIDELRSHAASYPAEAYVWKLDSSGTPPYAGSGYGAVVTIEPQTMIAQFPTRDQALDYMRSVLMTRPIALALFDRTSPHWPNPAAWHKGDDPGQEAQIAQFVESRGGARVSGTPGGSTRGLAYLGSDTVIGAALADVRRKAKTLAEKRAGNVIGVIHTPADNLWHMLAFRTADDADDWLDTATRDQAAYTYAAYFDKGDDTWPNPYIEKIGGTTAGPVRRERGTQHNWIGATTDPRARSVLEDLRSRAQQLAASSTPKASPAAGVIRTSEGLWHALGFGSLDDALDWLQAATQKDRTAFIYAAIFDKGSDGKAYFQQEEIGEERGQSQPQEIIRRGIATTSGHDYTVGGPWMDVPDGWAA